MKIDKLPRFNMSAFSSGEFDYEGPCVLVDSNGREWLSPNNPTPNEIDQAEEKALGEAVDKAMINWAPQGELNQKSFTTDIAPSWDGEGLPPVGCECEHIHHLLCDWTTVKILSHEFGVITYMWTNPSDPDNPMVMWDRKQSNFRPIETPWQKEYKKDRQVALAWSFIIMNSFHTRASLAQMDDDYIIDLAKRMGWEDDRS